MGIGTRISWPSVCGLRPSSDSRMARSTPLTWERSQTCTVIMRGSGTEIVAT